MRDGESKLESRAPSDAEFESKVDQCAQEANETLLWLELLRDDCGIDSVELEWLCRETGERRDEPQQT